MLFLCMRARLDIQTLVAFLAMRVRDLDEYDWGKLKWGLEYLVGMMYMKMYLRADPLNMISSWFDNSYGIHRN